MTRFNWMEKTGALKVEIDNDKLRQMGIDRQTVSMALQAELSGYTVAQYYEGDQAIDIVFRLPESDRKNFGFKNADHTDSWRQRIFGTGGKHQLRSRRQHDLAAQSFADSYY